MLVKTSHSVVIVRTFNNLSFVNRAETQILRRVFNYLLGTRHTGFSYG